MSGVLLKAGDFEESKHPRDEKGRFAPTVGYHGTSYKEYYWNIRDQGLKVPETQTTNRDHSGNRDKVVYLAPDEKSARKWAQAKFGDDAIVLRVEVPHGDKKFGGWVKHGGNMFGKEGLYEGDIPKEFITGTSRLRRVQGQGQFWEAYKSGDDLKKDAANIQGDLHKPGFLGRKKIKKDAQTLYVCRPVLNGEEIAAWAKANGISTVVSDPHVTIAYSKVPVDKQERHVGPLRIKPINPTVERFGNDGDCIVLTFDSPELEERWQDLIDSGCSWDWPSYRPHITLSWAGYNANDLAPALIEPYPGEIVLGSEEHSEIKENWKDGIVEKALVEIHKMREKEIAFGDARIAKVDDSLGLVFGYAIVCKVDGEDYFDLNVDKRDDGSYERVPEHIPEAAMLKAASDFMATDRVGNEMHKGDDKGTFLFAFPLTTDIAKAFGIQTRTTGLMVAYKPPPDVFAKFKSGEYKGFSIEGRRVSAKMRD